MLEPKDGHVTALRQAREYCERENLPYAFGESYQAYYSERGKATYTSKVNNGQLDKGKVLTEVRSLQRKLAPDIPLPFGRRRLSGLDQGEVSASIPSRLVSSGLICPSSIPPVGLTPIMLWARLTVRSLGRISAVAWLSFPPSGWIWILPATCVIVTDITI